ncbi:NMUR2 [Branchiostoma lanceolatum]|uniref:NMUR2 protein n=1 Tax=Branchiostoma lanceolatum TaxID=7740 RepID=A0A8J9VBU7_BRALA|nr:NMUR2 [Branchiostoma lanceolatum]
MTSAGKLTPFFEVLVFQASILTMVAVSADRYQGVCHPLLTQSSNRRRRALLSIALVWGLSLAASSPVLSIATYTEVDMNGTIICQCISTVDVAWKNHYTTVITVGFFVLPLLALTVMYIAIGRRLTRKPTGEINAHLQAQHRSRRRVVLMLGTVVTVFFVCLLPHRLFQMWILYAPVEQIEALGLQGFVKLTIFMRMMVYINCSLNPIIYTLFSTRFRAAFFKCCSSSEQPDSLRRAFTTGQAHRDTVRDGNRGNRDIRNRLLSEVTASNSCPQLSDQRPSNVTSAFTLTRLTSFPVVRSASNAGYNEPSFKQECGERIAYVWESHV